MSRHDSIISQVTIGFKFWTDLPTLVGEVSSGRRIALITACSRMVRILFSGLLLMNAAPAQADILRPGQGPNTFRFVQPVNISFSDVRSFPVTFSVKTLDGAEVSSGEMTDNGKHSALDLDLLPGTYHVVLTPTSSAIHEYASVELPDFHIDKFGEVFFPSGKLEKVTFFEVVHGMQPSGNAIIADGQPTLEWKAVTGAKYYILSFADSEEERAPERTNALKYSVKHELRPQTQYRWRIDAYGAKDDLLAYGIAWFRSRGKYEKDPATSKVITVAPGKGYVGVIVRRGDRLINYKPLQNDFVEGGEIVSAVIVRGVIPDSPAISAGIRPGDCILSVNGMPIEKRKDEDEILDFVSRIKALNPGEKVIMRLERGRIQLNVELVVGVLPPIYRKAGDRNTK